MTWSAANALLEHANLRLPFDRLLSLVITSPGVHKAHHSRTRCDRNYGNIFSVWDRLFSTFTPPLEPIVYGLDGYDDAQTTAGLLKLPFRP